MTFKVDKFKDRPETFLAEHERAIGEMLKTGLRRTRFIDSENSSVLYLLRAEGVLMELNVIEGLLFVESVAIPFRAYANGGHEAAVIEIQNMGVPTGLLSRKSEVAELLADGLETYRLWYESAYWTEEFL